MTVRETIDLIDTWIASHQALVVAVGIPVITAISAGLFGLLTNRASLTSKVADRELQKKMRIYESRMQKIGKIREASQRLESLILFSIVDLKLGVSTGVPNEMTSESTRKFMEIYIQARAELALFVDGADPELSSLQTALESNPFKNTAAEQSVTRPVGENSSFQICRRIIARMEREAEQELAR